MVQHGLAAFRRVNPDQQIILHTDDDIQARHSRTRVTADWERLRENTMTEQSDLWQLITMCTLGGMCTDIDRLCDQPKDAIMH